MNQTPISWQNQVVLGAPPQRNSHSLIFYNNKMIQFAQGSSDVYILNLSEWTWTKVKTSGAPRAKQLWDRSKVFIRYWINAVSIKDKAYFFGGCSSMDGGVFFEELMELNLNTFAWRQLQPGGDVPQGRVEHSMCVYKESVFLFGGRANKKIFNDLREMQGDRWTQIVCETQGPSYRFGHQGTIYEDILLLSGGCDGLTVLLEVWLYLINQKQWIKADCKGQIPQTLYRHACTIAGREHLIVFGGSSEDGKNYSDNFYALNLVQFKWIELPRFFEHPCPRIYHTLIALSIEEREELILCGGFSNGVNLSDLKILNFNLVADKVDLYQNSTVPTPLDALSQRSHTTTIPARDEFLMELKQSKVYQENHRSSTQKSSFSEFLNKLNDNNQEAFIELKQQCYEWKEEPCSGQQGKNLGIIEGCSPRELGTQSCQLTISYTCFAGQIMRTSSTISTCSKPRPTLGSSCSTRQKVVT